MNPYGQELILDMHECDESRFTHSNIKEFFKVLCERINMVRETLYWWDDDGLPLEECQTEPHLKGTSAVQFIMTSNIVIHTLDILKRVYLNIFSCKKFNPQLVKDTAKEFFGGEIINATNVTRI